MLVLTRKVGEKIRIGEDVTITVVRNHGGRTRLGIEAPSEMNIVRAELIEPDDREPPGGKRAA